jgi:hypothetical protein
MRKRRRSRRATTTPGSRPSPGPPAAGRPAWAAWPTGPLPGSLMGPPRPIPGPATVGGDFSAHRRRGPAQTRRDRARNRAHQRSSMVNEPSQCRSWSQSRRPAVPKLVMQRDRSAFLKGFEVSRDVVAGGVAGGLCAGARRQRSRGQGRPEAAPSGVGLDAGEQRRRVSAQARAAGLGSVARTRVLDDLRTGSSAAEAFLRPTVVGMVRSGTTTTGSSSSSTTPPVAGIMPITSSRRAVSEPAHAAVAGVWRQRISPSRSP